MPRSVLERIREQIRQGQYDMTAHAMEEMAEDDLDIGGYRIFDFQRRYRSD